MSKRIPGNLGDTGTEPVAFGISEEMEAFDALPSTMRNLLRDTPFPFSAIEIQEALDYGWEEKAILQNVKDQCTRAFNEKPYGDG